MVVLHVQTLLNSDYVAFWPVILRNTKNHLSTYELAITQGAHFDLWWTYIHNLWMLFFVSLEISWTFLSLQIDPDQSLVSLVYKFSKFKLLLNWAYQTFNLNPEPKLRETIFFIVHPFPCWSYTFILQLSARHQALSERLFLHGLWNAWR